MFHSWGLRVEGADLSENMIERARTNLGEPANLRWTVRGFDQPIEPKEPFDAAICIGNSLALAPDTETVQRAVREMLAAVRSGGVVVLHVLNLWRFPDGPCKWRKCKRATLERGDVLIAKGVHRAGAYGYVDLIIASLESSTKMQTDSIRFLGIEAQTLADCAENGGAAAVRVFGGYEEQPYDRETSTDLIVAATK